MTKQLERPRRAIANWFRSMWFLVNLSFLIKGVWLMLNRRDGARFAEQFRKLYFHRWLFLGKNLAGWMNNVEISEDFAASSALLSAERLNHMLWWQRSSYANWNLFVFSFETAPMTNNQTKRSLSLLVRARTLRHVATARRQLLSRNEHMRTDFPNIKLCINCGRIDKQKYPLRRFRRHSRHVERYWREMRNGASFFSGLNVAE